MLVKGTLVLKWLGSVYADDDVTVALPMALCEFVDSKNYKKGEVNNKSLNDVLHMKCLNRQLTMRFSISLVNISHVEHFIVKS